MKRFKFLKWDSEVCYDDDWQFEYEYYYADIDFHGYHIGYNITREHGTSKCELFTRCDESETFVGEFKDVIDAKNKANNLHFQFLYSLLRD